MFRTLGVAAQVADGRQADFAQGTPVVFTQPDEAVRPHDCVWPDAAAVSRGQAAEAAEVRRPRERAEGLLVHV
jgi:hypothetical protein